MGTNIRLLSQSDISTILRKQTGLPSNIYRLINKMALKEFVCYHSKGDMVNTPSYWYCKEYEIYEDTDISEVALSSIMDVRFYIRPRKSDRYILMKNMRVDDSLLTLSFWRLLRMILRKDIQYTENAKQLLYSLFLGKKVRYYDDRRLVFSPVSTNGVLLFLSWHNYPSNIFTNKWQAGIKNDTPKVLIDTFNKYK
jgi:hypothetical protein